MVLIAAFCGSAATAQNNSSIIQNRTHIFHVAPVVGRNISRLTLDSTNHTQGSLAGLSFTYRHKRKHISASTAVMYSSRGAEWKRVHRGQWAETYHWEFYEQLRYIEMPVKLTYIFFSDSTSKFRPKISAGPSFMFLMSAKRTSEYEIPEWLTSSEPTTVSVKDFYKPFDVGVTASIGFNWEFRQRRWLTLEAGYTHGLLDINKKAEITNSVMNRDFYVLAGLDFPIIRKRFR